MAAAEHHLKASQSAGPAGRQVDYDLHGLVGIRLLDPRPADEAAVTAQVGPIQSPLVRTPDITIRFVDRLALASPVRLVGLNDAAFTDDAFLVLRQRRGRPTRAQIPLDQVGCGCEIVCETGIPSVPLLIPIINLTALANGALPLHASAFNYEGTGVLVTGWAKGGKTEALLGFAAEGARYTGDEWVYLTADGRRMYGIPEPMRLWDWHLRQMPQFAKLLTRKERVRLKALRTAARSMERLSGGWRSGQPDRGSAVGRLAGLLRAQLNVRVAPQKLFGSSFGPLVGAPDVVFMVASHDSPDIAVRPADPGDVARRVAASLPHERLSLLAHYLKFRFAFPYRRSWLIEQAEAMERSALLRVLAEKRAYLVEHPYPVSIPALRDAMRPFCRREDERSAASDAGVERADDRCMGAVR